MRLAAISRPFLLSAVTYTLLRVVRSHQKEKKNTAGCMITKQANRDSNHTGIVQPKPPVGTSMIDTGHPPPTTSALVLELLETPRAWATLVGLLHVLMTRNVFWICSDPEAESRVAQTSLLGTRLVAVVKAVY